MPISPQSPGKTCPGNDVIDLDDVDCRLTLYRERVKERVFSQDELQFLAGSPDPVKESWILWAKKESAYKTLSRQNPELPFHWKKFEAHLPGKVLQGDRSVLCQVESGGGWIHATSWIDLDLVGEPIPFSMVARFPDRGFHFNGMEKGKMRQEESRAVREFAAGELEKKLGIRFVPAQDGNGKPILTSKEDGLVLPVSYSHHGSYMAFFLFIPS